MKNNHQQAGFSAVIVLAIVLIAIGASLFFLMSSTRNDKQATTNKTTPTQAAKKEQTKPTDPFADWKAYNNTDYGISFRYPQNWRVSEGAFESSQNSATKQEYAITLERNEETKYNSTISIEVLGEDLRKATDWYDAYFAQAPSNKVDKTTDQAKGLKSVQYAVGNLGKTKVYLFGFGNKTYTFASINEELNVQVDANYWTTFDSVFNSLKIDSP